MFQSVLIAEDFQIMNIGIRQLIEELQIPTHFHTQDCDQAFQLIKNQHLQNQPIDLLITDLHFNVPKDSSKVQSGFELVQKIREANIPLKIIVLSIEKNPLKIQNLVENLKVNGYIMKGKDDLNHCKKAIQLISKNGDAQYLSPEVLSLINTEQLMELSEFDFIILDLLTKGYKQKEISEYLKENEYSKTSLRSIENRLEELRLIFSSNTNMQLIATLKDLNLI